MCIVFIYSGNDDPDNIYSLVVASNRDEFFDRHAQNMAPWKENQNVIGGIDLDADCQSTWLAYSSSAKKFGLLLNYPELKKENPKSRGKIVADYINSNYTADKYVPFIRDYGAECNGFIFVTVEFSNKEALVQSFTNATNVLQIWKEKCLGFSNCLPDNPLKKVLVGKEKMAKICEAHKTIEDKPKLIENLLELLKTEHRTHTLMLVTKTGSVDLIEYTMQSPIKTFNPEWKTSMFKFTLF